TSETTGQGGRNNKASLNQTADTRQKSKFGDNIICVIPGAYTAALDGSINDVGVGVSYERLLDDKGHFGLVLPLMINFSSDKDFNNHYSYSSSYASAYKSYTSVLFAPGI